jgi:anti-anti-sigma regulatory factor
MALRLHPIRRASRDRLRMTLRIETIANGPITTIRLIGRIQVEILAELDAQILKARSGATGTRIVLDLEEVSLVDLDAVRFLGARQSEGVNLVNCSPYIRDWIERERVI